MQVGAAAIARQLDGRGGCGWHHRQAGKAGVAGLACRDGRGFRSERGGCLSGEQRADRHGRLTECAARRSLLRNAWHR